jgi:hypothetical protein
LPGAIIIGGCDRCTDCGDTQSHAHAATHISPPVYVASVNTSSHAYAAAINATSPRESISRNGRDPEDSEYSNGNKGFS